MKKVRGERMSHNSNDLGFSIALVFGAVILLCLPFLLGGLSLYYLPDTLHFRWGPSVLVFIGFHVFGHAIGDDDEVDNLAAVCGWLGGVAILGGLHFFGPTALEIGSLKIGGLPLIALSMGAAVSYEVFYRFFTFLGESKEAPTTSAR